MRWFQFGAFCPLFRLHGHRGGGPPSNECGGTNGDNEVWNLAEEPQHYESIVTVMRLREELREYVSQINAQAAATGFPMLRPMFLQFPLDPGCADPGVEDQFMFGPDWLVAPVTTYQATSRTVYLPLLNASSETWVYYYNFTEVGPGGGRFTVPTPIGEFPLFFRRPLPPPTPLVTLNATFLFNPLRNDTVTCLTEQCYDANTPFDNYTSVGILGMGVASSGSVAINGTTYSLLPITLFYSSQWQDNLVSTNSTGPDESYTKGVVFQNGYVLSSPLPGAVAVHYFYKKYSPTSQDYAMTAAGSIEAQWCVQRGYTNVTSDFPSGWLLPA